ncbi:MAG TPA: hypothetical protein VGG57_13790 [Stellaceae bacterium]
MSPVFPDLSVQISRRRSRCVLDPHLALSRDGPLLAKRLAPFAEQWVGPEFFNVLDSASLYLEEPELLVWPSSDATAIADVPDVLHAWTRLRDESNGCLSWIGDALRESSLPDCVDEGIVFRWELASRTLDQRLPHTLEATGPLVAATRDAAALCAVLPAARMIGRSEGDKPPAACRQLQKWGLDCRRLSADDPLARLECSDFLRLLADAGIAPSVWAGLHLSLVYLWLPRAGAFDLSPIYGHEIEPDLLRKDEEPAAWVNPWEGATCFWCDVTGPAS